MFRRTLILGVAVGLLCTACGLFDQGGSSGGGDHTTVIPITSGGGDSAAWVLVTVLVAVLIGAVVYAMNERSKRQRAEYEVQVQMLVAQGHTPMVNGRPYVTGTARQRTIEQGRY